MESGRPIDPYDKQCRCETCKLTPGLCVCGDLATVQIPVEVVLITTPGEMKSQSNTGALVRKVLANSRSLLYADPDAPFRPEGLADPTSDYQVFFPTPDARIVSPAMLPSQVGRRLSLVFLDTTWRRARRMSRRIPGLRRLPFARLPDGLTPCFPLRKPTRPGQLNTAEAVAAALVLLGFADAAEALRSALEVVSRRVFHIRGKFKRWEVTAPKTRNDE